MRSTKYQLGTWGPLELVNERGKPLKPVHKGLLARLSECILTSSHKMKAREYGSSLT
jgi:hypothetical protein